MYTATFQRPVSILIDSLRSEQPPSKMKVCSRCGISKPATTEFFHRSANSKSGFLKRCKECRNELNRKYYSSDYTQTIGVKYVDISKQRAQAMAQEWNMVKSTIGRKAFTNEELRNEAFKLKTKYICHYASRLLKSEYVILIGDKNNRLKKYIFSPNPIPFTFFIENAPTRSIKKATDKVKEVGGQAIMFDEKINLSEIEDSKLIDEVEKRGLYMNKEYTDKELVDKLREKGYTVTATKTIEL